MKTFRVLLIALACGAAVLGVLAGAAGPLADSPQAHRLLGDAVSRALGRRLALRGPIRLSLWPAPHVELGPLDLSNRDGTWGFVHADRLALGIRPLALLRGKVEVSRVEIGGLRLSLIRDKDGRTNIDDLLKPSPAPSPVLFYPEQVAIEGARVDLADARGGTFVTLSPLTVNGAHWRPGEPGQIDVDVRADSNRSMRGELHLSAGFRLDAARGQVELRRTGLTGQAEVGAVLVKRLSLSADGTAGRQDADWLLPALAARASLGVGGVTETVDAGLGASRFGARGSQLGAFSLSGVQDDAPAGLAVKASAPAQPNFASWDAPHPFTARVARGPASHALAGAWRWQGGRTLALDALSGQLDWPGNRLAWSGTARVQPARRAASARVAGQWRQSRFTGQVDLAAAPKPRVRADLAVDALDLDALQAAVAPLLPQHAGGKAAPFCADAGGALRVGQLRVRGLTARDATLSLAPTMCGRRG